MPINNAVELESVLRIRLSMDQMKDYWDPERRRQLVADHLEDMLSKGMIPPDCVVLDPRGWCRSMANRLRFGLHTDASLTEMCRAIMAPHLMASPGRRVPVSEYLRRLDRTPPDVIASVEDEERVAALTKMAVQASLRPSLLERLKDAKKIVEEAEEDKDATPFKRMVELD